MTQDPHDRPAIVFLPGGPGLPVAYAREPLRRAGLGSGWAFFEPPGCGAGESGAVDADAVREAALAFVAARGGPVALVAHSFGAWLALDLIERLPAGTVSRAVLLHPAPPTRAGLDESVAALMARVPAEALAQAGPLMARTDEAAGRLIMQALLPAYCGRTHDLPDLDLALRPLVYHGVTTTLGAYDQRATLAANAARVTLAFGETDHITPDLYARHAGPLDGFDVAHLRGGHFGFLEDSSGLAAMLRARGLA